MRQERREYKEVRPFEMADVSKRWHASVSFLTQKETPQWSRKKVDSRPAGPQPLVAVRDQSHQLVLLSCWEKERKNQARKLLFIAIEVFFLFA